MYFTVAIIILILDYIFITWLQLRQHRKFAITKLPDELLEFTTPENFLRTQLYGRDKRSSFRLLNQTSLNKVQYRISLIKNVFIQCICADIEYI
jgi:Ca2+/H+ antiporter